MREMLQGNMTGKICLVTGATNGIGKATAQALAQMGATVVIVGRNPAKCAAVVSEIKHISGNGAVEALIADLSVMAEVRQVADQFKAKYQKLHVLVNNAGGAFGKRQVTSEGFEKTFALNHLNYFLLTQELLPMLEASANGSTSRVVNVSSDAHESGKINFDDLQLERHFNGWRAYSNSKLANVMFTFELARRLEGKNVTANVLHPGFVRTNFGKNNGPLFQLAMPIAQLFAISPEEGAKTGIYLASSPDVEAINGVYFVRQLPRRAVNHAYDAEAARLLWERSAEFVEKQ